MPAGTPGPWSRTRISGAGPTADVDRARPRVDDGVLDEVRERKRHPVGVAPHLNRRLGKIERELDVARVGEGREPRRHGLGDAAQIDPRAVVDGESVGARRGQDLAHGP